MVSVAESIHRIHIGNAHYDNSLAVRLRIEYLFCMIIVLTVKCLSVRGVDLENRGVLDLPAS